MGIPWRRWKGYAGYLREQERCGGRTGGVGVGTYREFQSTRVESVGDMNQIIEIPHVTRCKKQKMLHYRIFKRQASNREGVQPSFCIHFSYLHLLF